jgi:hypothetical protein
MYSRVRILMLRGTTPGCRDEQNTDVMVYAKE